MKSFRRYAASFVLASSLLLPAFAQSPVPFSAVVENIEFKDVPQFQQKGLLDLIGVRVGDKLTVDARQRIGQKLGELHKGMTFTYKQGSKPGTAKLVISADC